MAGKIESVFPFCSVLGAPVPEECILDREMLTAALAKALTERGIKINAEETAAILGTHERTLRRKLADGRPIRREQVARLVEHLDCSFGDLMRNPKEHAWAERRARDREEAAAWPVPLVSYERYVDYLRDIHRAVRRTMEEPRNEVLLPEAAPLLQEAWNLARSLTGNPGAMFEEATQLKQALEPLAKEHGIYLLRGRFMERYEEHDRQMGWEMTAIRHRLHLAFRRAAGDSGHCMDRSHEPLEWSQEEDAFLDDGQVVAGWLGWEGKHRLLCWEH